MRGYDRLAIAAAVATMLTSLTLLVATQDRSYLGWSLLLVTLMTGIGAAVRRTRAAEGGALLAQLVVLAGYLFSLGWWTLGPVSAGAATEGPDGTGVSTPFAWIGRLIASGIGHMQQQSAPMQPHDGVVWLMVAAVGIVLLLTDLLVCTLHQPAWGIAPSLTLFLLPALTLRSDLGVAGGLAVIVGYLGVLLADNLNRAERWRRGVIDDARNPPRPVAPVVWGSAALVTVPALALTLLAWLVIPTTTLGVPTSGGNVGNGPIQLGDPTLDLRRNLVQPEDVQVLSYTSTGGSSQGTYLRLASLPLFNAGGWQNTQIQLVQGQPGAIPGGRDSTTDRRSTTIRIGDFDSEYLPLPYAPRQLNVSGTWGYDPLSLVYVAMEGNNRGQATRNLTYTVESTDIDPDPAVLSTARAGTPDDNGLTAQVPDDLPQSVVDLARRITADASTPALKAAAIQAYLRSDEFTYSTNPGPGSGFDALTNFLFRDRTGYCEQFAAAMAVMARVVDIPSRVAVGFLPGDRDGKDWVVTTHDLHAWPELYFEGIGWVRWEPTPGNGAVAPSWTQVSDNQPTSSSTATNTDEVEPTLDPRGSSSASEGPTEEATSSEAGNGATDSGWGVTALIVLLGGAVLVLGAATPGLLRARQRRLRLGPASGHADGEAASAASRVDRAWQEVRATVVDFRGDWPSGSPRVIARQLSRGLASGDAADVARLALWVEQTRYARGIVADPDLTELRSVVTRVRAAIIEPASRWQRIRAAVWPRSLWRSAPGDGLSGRRGL